MNDYEERQQAKRERLQHRAATKAAQGERSLAQARTLAEAIPFGQPVLVGHHSEGRDRRYRAKIQRTFGRGFQALSEAQELQRRAEAVGTGGISSDDPEAVGKLKHELAVAEATQERMKQANLLVRKGDRLGLIALGFTEHQADQIMRPDFAGRTGFPSYALSNNSAAIRRLRLRIEELENRRRREDVEEVGNGYTYREDIQDNRVLLIFDQKPGDALRAQLKSAGFKWSPRRGAWTRQWSQQAIYQAAKLRKQIESLPDGQIEDAGGHNAS